MTTHHDREPGAPRPWPRLKQRHGPPMMIFRPRWDTLTNPRTGQEFERLVLETPGLGERGRAHEGRRLVFVRQFRFGTSAVTLEIPGGVIDLGEEHGHAAERELREETGFTSSSWRYLGAVEPNPAFHTNLCHHWLAQDCERTHDLELDHGEDIEIGTLSIDETRARIQSGEIRHALVITALSRVFDLRPEAAAEARPATRSS